MQSQQTKQSYCATHADLLAFRYRQHKHNPLRSTKLKSPTKLLLAVFVTLMACTQLASASVGVEMEKVSQGTLFYTSAHDHQSRTAPMQNTAIDMHVTGIINRVHLIQTFINDSSDWVEGVYVFPLPENAAVDHMRIRAGDRIIEGEIKPRAEAKKVYETAKAQGKRASLLEQERPNMFTTSVANIPPHAKVSIVIEFQQVLRYHQGKFHLRFPLAITPRYIPGNSVASASTNINSSSVPSDKVADADRITPIVALDKKVNPVSLHIELDAGFPINKIESPYHAINKEMQDEGRYTITLAQGQIPADRDFELVWEPMPGNAPRAAMFREKVGAENYYLVMMLPPNTQTDNKLVMAREVIYVIDTSGSMGGVSIRQARKALQLALQRLRPDDTFNVIQFNSSTDKLFNRSQPANLQNIVRAQHYVSNLQAGGGTEMLPAMQAALSTSEDSEHLRQVIFLTDGAVGNEDALFEYIRHRLGNSRLFTIGIGSAPNSHFMTKAAQFGRGTFTNISDVNEVESKMKALFAKLDSPIMRDLTLTQYLGDFEMWPQTLPDLYAEEPVIFTARSHSDRGEVAILGKRNTEQWQTSFYLQNASDGAGIGKLWARNKIDAFIDSLHDGADKEAVRNAVTQLALDHHLVSKYTSLVAVDVTPIRPSDASLKSQAVPTNLPLGQDAGKIFGLQAKTGTEQYQLLLTGILLLLFALGLLLTNRRQGDICAH